ncbi:hypothetical protein TNCT_377011 [Trichonephila clavata]|uniref:Uncharacterized protein n=1 Tax=Trichonephila clavata TaxID=2740835 RepID=A0A8X6EYM1_TRICU|nr:hypothetical protein TNCT_377011 [Trichonephila clavata]
MVLFSIKKTIIPRIFPRQTVSSSYLPNSKNTFVRMVGKKGWNLAKGRGILLKAFGDIHRSLNRALMRHFSAVFYQLLRFPGVSLGRRREAFLFFDQPVF